MMFRKVEKAAESIRTQAARVKPGLAPSYNRRARQYAMRALDRVVELLA